MDFGMNFPASVDAAAQARLAEELGFTHVGYYDTPALEADVWIAIANAVQATQRIRVGTYVLIPHLRHPMTQASAIATIEQLAPGRLYVGVGTGFSGRMAMGQPALTWSYMRRFLTSLRGLLAGERVEIDGAVMQMLHSPGFAARRPIRVTILVAATGPKGIEVARELGDGIIWGGDPADMPTGFSIVQTGFGGIILQEGETASSPRVIEAAKLTVTLRYHGAYERASVDDMPYGAEWREALERHPAEFRHLVIHEGHTVEVNEHDAAFFARHPDVLEEAAARMAVTPAQVREQVDAIAARGATMVSFPPFVAADWETAMRNAAAAVGL